LNSKYLFDQFYRSTTAKSYSRSLFDFFEGIVRSRLSEGHLKILELGSGHYSLFEDVLDLNAEITAIDYSAAAIEKATDSKIKYELMNVLEPNYFKSAKYDLIFDSHCLNCIENNEERSLAFKNIYSALKVAGLFASEIMVQPENKAVSMPFKKIKSAFQVEQVLIYHGFKIQYFLISKEMAFSTLMDGEEVKCDVLRIIAKK
jgi:SAM-dependent methyltransferase